jgi:uncharacterized HhH-GPD family protein
MTQGTRVGKAAPARLHLSGDARADALLSTDPLALLIGMVLDQQVPLEWAFHGPVALVDRLDLAVPIAASRLARMDPATLRDAFARKPSLHRYPGSMAERVQALAAVVADEYGGDAARIWREAADGEDLRRRVQALPGFGAHKARIFVALLGKQLGVRPAGWREASAPFGDAGTRMSVADIVDGATLDEVRRTKRLVKEQAKQAGAPAR